MPATMNVRAPRPNLGGPATSGSSLGGWLSGRFSAMAMSSQAGERACGPPEASPNADPATPKLNCS